MATRDKEIGLVLLLAEDDFKKDFQNLLSIEPDQLNKLADHINKESTYGLSDISEATPIVEELAISSEAILSAMRIATFIHKQLLDENITINDFIEELEHCVKFLGIVNFNDKIAPIRKLFSLKEGHIRNQRIKEYSTEGIQNLRSIAIVHDIRPVFSKDESKIIDLIPILIIKLRLVSGDDENLVSFQLSEDTFQNFIKEIEKSKEKLDSIKSSIIKKVDLN